MLGDVLQAVGWAFLPSLILPVLYLLRPSPRFRRFIEALIRTIDRVIYRLGEIVKWSLPLLVLSVAASVFALSIFGAMTVKWLESAFYFQAVIIMLGAAATLLASQHVRVDVLYSGFGARARARVDLIAFYLLLAPVCLLIIWNSQSFVDFAWRTFEGSAESNGIRGVFLLKTLIPIFGITMIMQGLAIALRAAMALNGEARPARPPGIEPFFATEDKPHLSGGDRL